MINSKSKYNAEVVSYLIQLFIVFGAIMLSSLIMAAMIINEVLSMNSISIGVKVILVSVGFICGLIISNSNTRRKIKTCGILSGIIALIFLSISIIATGKVSGSVILNVILITSAMMLGMFIMLKNKPKNKKYKMRYR